MTRVDLSVLLMHHDLRDLGLLTLRKLFRKLVSKIGILLKGPRSRKFRKFQGISALIK